MLVHHKWFIRAGLAMFWAAEVIAWAFDYGFITYLLIDHTWIMMAIIFLTFMYFGEPFYSLFFGFTTKGGEKMEKSNKIMGVIIAILLTLIVLMAYGPTQTMILNALQQSVANPIYYAGVAINNWLGTYPALWTFGAGGGFFLMLAIVLNTFVRPRITNRNATPKSKGSNLSLSSSPAGTTTRPATKEKVVVNIEEVAAKVKEELVKEPTPA